MTAKTQQAEHTPGNDQFSYHEVSCDGQRGFAVVRHNVDEYGDIVDSEEVEFYRSERQAARRVRDLGKAPYSGIVCPEHCWGTTKRVLSACHTCTALAAARGGK